MILAYHDQFCKSKNFTLIHIPVIKNQAFTIQGDAEKEERTMAQTYPWIGFKMSGNPQEEVNLCTSITEAIKSLNPVFGAEYFLGVVSGGRLAVKPATKLLDHFTFELARAISTDVELTNSLSIDFAKFQAGWTSEFAYTDVHRSFAEYIERNGGESLVDCQAKRFISLMAPKRENRISALISAAECTGEMGAVLPGPFEEIFKQVCAPYFLEVERWC